jgi:hypothetical protein
MRQLVAPVLLPLVAGLACAIFVSASSWDAQAAKLLTALSVMGAAVLVRLARGLSMPSAEAMENDEARRLAAAIRTMIRRLRLLILVILGTMVLLVGLPGAASAIAAIGEPGWATFVQRAASGVIGFAIAYVLVRMIQVVNSDVDLADIQADVFIKSLARKDQKKFDEARNASTVAPFRSPDSYGKKIS